MTQAKLANLRAQYNFLRIACCELGVGTSPDGIVEGYLGETSR